MIDDTKQTTRVTLSSAELKHLASFAESVDDPDHAEFWDALTNKLERGIARILNSEPIVRRTLPVASMEPDQRPAQCRACGWIGTLSKTGPCPSCGQKCNPFLFTSR